MTEKSLNNSSFMKWSMAYQWPSTCNLYPNHERLEPPLQGLSGKNSEVSTGYVCGVFYLWQ